MIFPLIIQAKKKNPEKVHKRKINKNSLKNKDYWQLNNLSVCLLPFFIKTLEKSLEKPSFAW